MDIYIYLCILFAFSAIIEKLLPANVRKGLFVLNGLVLLIIVGGRSCGTDYWLYKLVIEYGNIVESQWPILYATLAGILPFQLLVFLVAFFTIVPFYLLIYRFSGQLYNFCAAFFFTEYFFMTLMQQSRQGVAMAFIAWAIFVFSNERAKYIVTIILGSMIHVTGYFGVFPLFLRKKFYRPKVYILSYILSVLMGGVVLNFLFSNIAAFGVDLFTNKLFGYADRTDRLEAEVSIFSFRFLIFLSLLFYCYKNRQNITSPFLPYICNIVFFGICFFTLFVSIVDLSVRGSSCFIRLYYFIIAMLLNEGRINILHKNGIYIFSIAYCIYLMVQYMNMIVVQNDSLDIIPYHFL